MAGTLLEAINPEETFLKLQKTNVRTEEETRVCKWAIAVVRFFFVFIVAFMFK
jgi:hypothetical protein